MEKIALMIFFGAFTLLIPSFAFYRGICHGKARHAQKRTKRISPAIKRALIYCAIFAALIAASDSETLNFQEDYFAFAGHFLEKLQSSFLGLFIVCGIPFIIGILLPRHRKL